MSLDIKGCQWNGIKVIKIFLLIPNTFYYNVKYKTITKNYYLQMYKVQDYITYFGYKQTNICSELFIQYKNTSVSYKLLHFAAAVHWRLPSPLKKMKCLPDLSQIAEERFPRNTKTIWHFFISPFLYNLWYLLLQKNPSESLSTILYKLTLYLKSMAMQVKCVYKYICI